MLCCKADEAEVQFLFSHACVCVCVWSTTQLPYNVWCLTDLCRDLRYTVQNQFSHCKMAAQKSLQLSLKLWVLCNSPLGIRMQVSFLFATFFQKSFVQVRPSVLTEAHTDFHILCLLVCFIFNCNWNISNGSNTQHQLHGNQSSGALVIKRGSWTDRCCIFTILLQIHQKEFPT